MNSFSFILSLLIAAGSAFTTNRLLRVHAIQIPLSFWYLFWFLPFLAGGFHTYMAAMTAIILLADLFRMICVRRHLNIAMSISVVTCVVIVLGYCLTPFWAADRGMAVWGIPRCCPVLLLSILLMQYPDDQKKHCFILIPICGAVMTIASCILWCIPATQDFVMINGRLSGFLQYPNTFAAFLLAGIAVLAMTPGKKVPLLLLGFVLIAGILLSGSRTSILLLAFLVPAIYILQKKNGIIVLILVAAVTLIASLFLIRRGDQITFLGRDIGSLFVRILYYKDALPIILQHPFGLGYMGYRALETTFQTSRYTVSFVHSNLLQLMLDIGWVPAILFSICIGKHLTSPKTVPVKKLVLIVLACHSLIDFDMEFFLFWAILLLCLDTETATVYHLRNVRIPSIVTGAMLLLLCAWLGLGDLLYQSGNYEQALKIAPFHTDALAASLKTTSDPDELDRLSDRILNLNPTHSLAYSAKANAAYSRGQVSEMIQYKEKAIRLTPYTTEEYCDYIEKLYTVMELFVQTGDQESSVYCLKKVLAVPEMMEAAADKIPSLAYKTGNSAELVLPEEYQQLIAELTKANPGMQQ